MRWNKKAALELSITAIVVLIIAITVLGLAIFFIKNLFKGGTDIFTGELAKIKEQLKKNLEETGELVVMDRGTELEVKRGERLDFHIGARNTDTSKPRCFRIAMICKNPFTTGEYCVNGKNDVLVGGESNTGDSAQGGENWFPRLLAQFEVPAGDIAVSPVTLQIANARPDTYLMEMQVIQGNDDCQSVDWGSPETTMQTKRFNIALS
jgi:hypothetical protein